MEVDKLDIDKLHLEQDSPKEEKVEVTNSLIPPPTTGKEEKKATNEKNNGRDDRSRKQIPTRRKVHATGVNINRPA